MTKSKYRSKMAVANKDEPHRGGGSWQDALDCELIAKYQAEYETKTACRKGKEVVQSCAQAYLNVFEGRLKSRFNVWKGYVESAAITDHEGWKAFIDERTDVCSYCSILYFMLIRYQQIENALRRNINNGPGKKARGIGRGLSVLQSFLCTYLTPALSGDQSNEVDLPEYPRHYEETTKRREHANIFQ
jgi:hypothetical protein